ncbi:MAG: 16S rRNA (adenine(1518)-N(6)/adenine(1519)-N(6))-dimethyltransferase RsmA [bacterium]|nr:16S rRNA (adenine(1518)-N(6)/adenine(1519)-N(6))-dimethyltransferase RsmA [bacterium]
MDGFKFKKSLGQNFLIDNNIIDKIMSNIVVDEDTLVIEIGAGSGNLTCNLASICKKLICFEIDGRLESTLKKRLACYSNVNLIMQDFLKADISTIIENCNLSKLVVVSNLPYYITTAIINKFIENNIFPDKFLLMMQLEVGNRITANVGTKNYNSLTVCLNYYYNINKLFVVKRTCFKPIPNVDSVVISMNKKIRKLSKDEEAIFLKLVRDSFRQKRKTLKNNLDSYDLNLMAIILNKLGKDLSVRAENLTIDDFVEISKFLFNH